MQAPVLFSIATDLGRMQVNASVDEADIGSISEGSDVTFTVDAYPNDQFHGTIAEIRLSPQTVQNVVTYSVILAIENPGNKLKPGMTANITVTVDERTGVLKLPNAALRYSPPNQNRDAARTGVGERGARGERGNRGEGGRSMGELRQTPPRREPQGVDLPLAPGQKWDPGNKVRFTASNTVRPRPGTVWVLGADRVPQPRRVITGLTDGTATEVISGELAENELVIVGDATQTDSSARGGGNQPGFGLRIGIGGGGGRR
jgi:HlyD family secretion protein